MTLADIWRFYQALVRRRWLFAAVAGSALAVVSLGCLLLPRYYRATALVMPSEEALSQPAVTPSGAVQRREADPQIRSSKLADLINLAQSEAVINRVRSRVGITSSPQSLLRRVSVETLPDTSIIRIAVLDQEPRRAVEIARATASSFAQFYQDLSRREAAATRRFLEDQLAVAESDLHKAETDLAAFYRTTDRPQAPESSGTAAVAAQQERDAAQASLAETQARLAKRRAQLRQVPAVLVRVERTTDETVLAQLRTELANLESELASERAVHTDNHPNVVRLSARTADVRKRLEAQSARLVPRRSETPNPAYDALVAEIANLEAQKVAFSARLGALTSATASERDRGKSAAAGSVALAAPLRAQKVAEESYARLRAAVDQARIDEKVTTQTGSVRVVDLPRAAYGPLTRGGALWQLLLVGAVLSAALGVAAAIGADILDDRLRSREDVRRVLQMPVTAVIPAIEGEAVALPQITSLAPVSPYAEAYRFLRTDVFFTARDQMVQTIMVATPKPGQGGTTTICNLAIAMAEADRRVILVDAVSPSSLARAPTRGLSPAGAAVGRDLPGLLQARNLGPLAQLHAHAAGQVRVDRLRGLLIGLVRIVHHLNSDTLFGCLLQKEPDSVLEEPGLPRFDLVHQVEHLLRVDAVRSELLRHERVDGVLPDACHVGLNLFHEPHAAALVAPSDPTDAVKRALLRRVARVFRGVADRVEQAGLARVEAKLAVADAQLQHSVRLFAQLALGRQSPKPLFHPVDVRRLRVQPGVLAQPIERRVNGVLVLDDGPFDGRLVSLAQFVENLVAEVPATGLPLEHLEGFGIHALEVSCATGCPGLTELQHR